jgi:3-dehydroquinate dehydratase-1
VITTMAGLRRAAGMKIPPDLFEIRLDHFEKVERRRQPVISAAQIARLPAPVILTARHPAEGGANRLSLARRRDLLLRFLPHARYIDVELRSARALADVMDAARGEGIKIIISFHDFRSTPTTRSLCTKAAAARRLRADVFKCATRADTRRQFERLLDFAARTDRNLSSAIMAMGKFALSSRVRLARGGTDFIYGAIGRARLAGQPTLAQLRSALARPAARIT